MDDAERDMQELKSGSKNGGWNLLNFALGATGAATGITALATKVPKNGRGRCGYGYGDYGTPFYGGHCDGVNSPSAFQAWEKSCDDAVELTKAIYQGRITELNEARAAREIDVDEKFRIWKGVVDGDFGLYKNQRDSYDALAARIGELETKVAVNAAIRPYQDALIGCKIDKVADHAAFNLERRTCRMIEGEVVLQSTPTVTGFQSASRCRCNATQTAPAA